MSEGFSVGRFIIIDGQYSSAEVKRVDGKTFVRVTNTFTAKQVAEAIFTGEEFKKIADAVAALEK